MECRKIEYDSKKIIQIIQDLKYGYAGEVWDSALVLCNSVKLENFRKMFNFEGKVILEIGSGTGVCGIFISLFSPELIILTDKKEALTLINKNIEENKNIIPTSTKIFVEEFNWEDDEKLDYYTKNFKFDYIICSDIIYDENQYENLQKIFFKLAIPKYTFIILSFNYREETGLGFFDYFKKDKKWDFKKLSENLIHEDFRCDDILLLYAQKLS